MRVRKDHQSGSTISFVIIAIVLIVLTIAAVVFVQQRGEQARKDEATKIAAQQQADQEAAEAARIAADAQKAQDEATGESTSPITDLPETGIELDIIRTLAIGLLVASGVSYVTSRRSVKRSL